MSPKLHSIALTINGRPVRAEVPARLSLVDFLRDTLRLTGTHVGCEHGICGACSVISDGVAVRSCLMLAVQADGCALTTIEGLCNADGSPGRLQEAFCEAHAMQCGYCTPGMVVAAHALLAEHPAPSEAQVREALSGNLCRCTGYVQIVEAVQRAARAK